MENMRHLYLAGNGFQGEIPPRKSYVYWVDSCEFAQLFLAGLAGFELQLPHHSHESNPRSTLLPSLLRT
jgi:hypothetical protein